MQPEQQGGDHWYRHANHWSSVGSPLRPCAQDIDAMTRLIRQYAPAAAQGLLLGATPELAQLGNQLLAVDRNAAMLSRLAAASTQTLQADWRALPLAESRFDFVLSDGAFNMLHFAADYHQVLRELDRVTQDQAILVIRLFIQPDVPETLEFLKEQVWSGQLGNFHSFKWRLAMALLAVAQAVNLPVQQIHAAFEQHFPDQDALVAQTGWSAALLDTLRVYADSSLSYSFPSLDAFLQLLDTSAWQLMSLGYGQYDLAERCPIMILGKR